MTENEIGTICIDAAIGVHRELGPGLMETVYETVLAHELVQRGLRVERQVPITISYKGLTCDEAFRAVSRSGHRGGVKQVPDNYQTRGLRFVKHRDELTRCLLRAVQMQVGNEKGDVAADVHSCWSRR